MSQLASTLRTLAPLQLGRLQRLAATLGPGLVVMLADTDAGSVLTAAQSGAQWGYRLLLLQFLIIPLLFMVQELTVRLALSSGKGYGELVLQRFGRGWARLSTTALILSCFGALLTEMSGLSGVAQLYGVPVWQSVAVLALLIFLMVASGSYRQVERMAMLLGVAELAFLWMAWRAWPQWSHIRQQLLQLPLHDSSYLYLLAANLGSSVMPWTVFYQQSALIDKGLNLADLRAARMDTMLGAVLCQLITAAVLIAAASVFAGHGAVLLDTIPELATAFGAALGPVAGRLLFALALSGGALVATIVVCLSAAWALGELGGRHHALAEHPRAAPWFYAAFALMLLLAAAVVAISPSLVRLSIATGVLNALLLPLVLCFLYRLARSELPAGLRPQGPYAVLVAVLFVLAGGLGLFAGITGALAA